MMSTDAAANNHHQQEDDDNGHREHLRRAFEAARALIPRLRLLPDKKPWFYESIARHYAHTMPMAEFEAARAEVRALVQGLRVSERLEADSYWQSQSDRILEHHLAPFKPFFATMERRGLLREAIDEERSERMPPVAIMVPGSDRFFKGLVLKTLYTMLDVEFDICYMGKVHATQSFAQEARFYDFMRRARKRKALDDEDAPEPTVYEVHDKKPRRLSRKASIAREADEMASAAF